MNGKELVSSLLKEHGQKPFLITMKEEQHFAAFGKFIDDAVKALPVREQRSVAVIQCKRPVNFVRAYFTAISANMVPLPISNLVKSREFLQSIRGAAFLFTDCDLPNDGTPMGRCTDLLNGLRVLELLQESYAIANKQVAVLLPTSGTTGVSRKVMLGFSNLLSNVKAFLHILPPEAHESTIALLQFCYSFAHTTQMWSQLVAGGRLIVTDGPVIPKQILSLCDTHKPRTTGVVAQTIQLFQTQSSLFSRFDTSSLQCVVVAGGFTQQEVMHQAQMLFHNASIIQGYGQTEASPRISMERPDDVIRIHNGIRSSGRPVEETIVKVVGEEGIECPHLSEGMILVNGPGVMLGYFEDEEATSHALREGWLHTGDLGFVDEDGYLYVRGRLSNMFVHKGFKVYPEEVEACVMEDSRVAACHAYLENGTYILSVESKESIQEDEILNHLSTLLPYWKTPNVIRFEEIKRTTTGKILRNERGCQG